MLRKSIATVAALLLVLMIGCSAVMDGVTPCYIESEAAIYAGVEDTSEFLPYTTLWDAKKLDNEMDYMHQVNQITIARLLEDDNVVYSHLKDITTQHNLAAVALQNTIFDPAGPIGMLFPALFAGTAGALLIRRPGDKTKKEFDEVKNGGTV